MNEVIEIPVAELNQVRCVGDIRHRYDDAFVDVLANTFKKSEQLTPCEGWIEESNGERKIFIDAGENRYRAAVKAQVPLKVKIGSKRNPLGILKSAMVENTHTPMTPADEIHLCTRVVKECGNMRSAAKLFADAGRTDFPQARIKKLYELGQKCTDKVLDIIADPESPMTLNRLSVLAQKQFGLTDTEIEAFTVMVHEGVKRFELIHEDLRARLRPKTPPPEVEKKSSSSKGSSDPKELSNPKERKPKDSEPFDPFGTKPQEAPEPPEDLRTLALRMKSLMGSKTSGETRETIEKIEAYASAKEETQESITTDLKVAILDVLAGHVLQEKLFETLGLISADKEE